MDITEAGIDKEPVKPLHREKADSLIEVTELGIIKVPVKPQLLNEYLPIKDTVLGIFKEPVKPLQP